MSLKNSPANTTNDEYDILFQFKPENKIYGANLEEDNVVLDKVIEETQQNISETERKWSMNQKVLDLYSEKMNKDQDLKGKYAIILIIVLIIELILLIVIFILKGCNILEYSDMTFNIFITGGIAEVFVLVKVIVEYLFKDNLTGALNIILENNNKKAEKP